MSDAHRAPQGDDVIGTAAGAALAEAICDGEQRDPANDHQDTGPRGLASKQAPNLE
jgi:hypothetical protein